MKRSATAFMLAALAACSQPQGAEKAADGAAQAPAALAAASGGDERFFGREAFTLVYRHSGSQSGTSTTHVREYGRKRVEINDTALSVAGMTHRTRTRVIYEGPRVITVDAQANTATAITNPLYEQVVAAMRGRSGVEFGEQIMTQMGGRKTGESGVFVGQSCEYWEIAQLGSRSCVTPWGATLHLRSSLGGVLLEQTATDVRLGDGGPDAAFAYDPAQITEGPNVGAIMNRLKAQ